VRIGELVWLRAGPESPTWGLIVDELLVYLTDNSVMVTYEVLANCKVYNVDSGELLRFNYYNRHLYDEHLDT